MPYQITKFGSVTLPIYSGDNDLNFGQIQERFVDLPGGGSFDAWGSERAAIQRNPNQRGGEIVAASPADFRTQFNTLRALIGVRDKLWREWDDGTLEWTYARLVAGGASRQSGNILDLAVDLSFVQVSPSWYGDTASSTTTDLVSSPQTIVESNGGNADVANAIITITAPGTLSTPITSITIAISAISSFTWSGSLAAGDVLVIDCGAWSIKKNGVAAWNVSFDSSHTINGMLVLAPGSNSIDFSTVPAVPANVAAYTSTGLLTPPTYNAAFTVSAVTVKIEFYDGWA